MPFLFLAIFIFFPFFFLVNLGLVFLKQSKARDNKVSYKSKLSNTKSATTTERHLKYLILINRSLTCQNFITILYIEKN